MKKTALLLVIVMLAGMLLTACGEKAVTIQVLNWGDYIDPELLDRFEDETGIKVNYTTMANNEEMLVKLSSPDCIYDLCFPSDYIIEKLIADDMLHPLDKSNIPNIANIDPRFMDLSFDPQNLYSVPYMWGTVGVLYNTTMVEEADAQTWGIFWNEKYSGQILMYDSIRDTIGVTLKYLGHSLNTREESAIKEAEEALISQKRLVYAYLGDSIKERMIGGNGAAALVYSGDAMWCMDEEEGNPDLAYTVPMEGSNLWFDNVVIPKTSKHTAEAEMFINFLCDAEVAKANTEYIGYSTPNAAAMKLLEPEMLANETYNPPQEVLDRCEIFHDLGDFIEVYNEAWINVKSHVD